MEMLWLTLPLVGFATVFVYPLVMLRPILRLTRRDKTPVARARFSISDLLSLMFLIQLPIVMFNISDRQFDQDLRFMVVIYMLLALTVSFLIWVAGLRAANHIGILGQMKRIVAIGFTFPAATTGGMFVGALCVNVPLMLFGDLGSPNDFPTRNIGAAAALVLAASVLTLLIYVSVRWVVRDSVMERERTVGPTNGAVEPGSTRRSL